MRRTSGPLKLLALSVALLTSATTRASAEGDQEALTLLRFVEDQQRATCSISTFKVQIKRPDWERTLRVHSIDDRDNARFAAKLLAPRKSKGTSFFKVEGQLEDA